MHGRGYRAGIVLAGTNDLRRGGGADDIWPTLSALYEEIRADGARLVVVTVPPFRGWAGDPWSEERPAEIRELNRRIARYCAANACAVADAHTLLADPEDPTALAPALDVGDHLHPSQAGLDRLAELVRTRLEP